jgi:uncharacterized protein (TIGR02145 family)/uncharacterized repeat protein (TIGR02543 family)
VTSGSATIADPNSASTSVTLTGGGATIRANFYALTYTITYNLNGGTNGANPASYTIESGTINLAEATKTSYTFDGWYDNEALSGTKVTSIPGGSTGNREFWAKWIITDIDGNIYTEVTIGTQVWLVENLKTTRYRDGTAIARVTDPAEWEALSTTGYCWYNNDSSMYNADYGILYNWYAVSDARQIAPAGWHIPTDAEWSTIEAYLGGSSVAGGKLKEAGTAHWNSPNTGATNESGFSAFPGGYRFVDGPFYSVGSLGNWWSATEYGAADAWFRGLLYNYSDLYRSDGNKGLGFSVRCVRD